MSTTSTNDPISLTDAQGAPVPFHQVTAVANGAPVFSPTQDLSTLSDAQLQAQIQQSYDTLNHAGIFKNPAYTDIGHQIRATGIITDPTQGGLVTPAAPAMPNPAPVAPKAPATTHASSLTLPTPPPGIRPITDPVQIQQGQRNAVAQLHTLNQELVEWDKANNDPNDWNAATGQYNHPAARPSNLVQPILKAEKIIQYYEGLTNAYNANTPKMSAMAKSEKLTPQQNAARLTALQIAQQSNPQYIPDAPQVLPKPSFLSNVISDTDQVGQGFKQLGPLALSAAKRGISGVGHAIAGAGDEYAGYVTDNGGYFKASRQHAAAAAKAVNPDEIKQAVGTLFGAGPQGGILTDIATAAGTSAGGGAASAAAQFKQIAANVGQYTYEHPVQQLLNGAIIGGEGLRVAGAAGKLANVSGRLEKLADSADTAANYARANGFADHAASFADSAAKLRAAAATWQKVHDVATAGRIRRAAGTAIDQATAPVKGAALNAARAVAAHIPTPVAKGLYRAAASVNRVGAAASDVNNFRNPLGNLRAAVAPPIYPEALGGIPAANRASGIPPWMSKSTGPVPTPDITGPGAATTAEPTGPIAPTARLTTTGTPPPVAPIVAKPPIQPVTPAASVEPQIAPEVAARVAAGTATAQDIADVYDQNAPTVKVGDTFTHGGMTWEVLPPADGKAVTVRTVDDNTPRTYNFATPAQFAAATGHNFAPVATAQAQQVARPAASPLVDVNHAPAPAAPNVASTPVEPATSAPAPAVAPAAAPASPEPPAPVVAPTEATQTVAAPSEPATAAKGATTVNNGIGASIPPRPEPAPKPLAPASITDRRAAAVLDTKVNYSDGGVQTRRQFIDRKIAEGSVPKMVSEPDYAKEEKLREEMRRIANSNAYSANRNYPGMKRYNEIEAELANGTPKKTWYGLQHTDGVSTVITKTEHDYAQSRMAKQPAEATAPVTPAARVEAEPATAVKAPSAAEPATSKSEAAVKEPNATQPQTLTEGTQAERIETLFNGFRDSVKPQLYTVPLGNGHVSVEGKPVEIPGHDDTKFFVHHVINADGFGDGYTVSEQSSGLNIGRTASDTPEEAIAKATNQLDCLPPTRMKEIIDRGIKQFGSPPDPATVPAARYSKSQRGAMVLPDISGLRNAVAEKAAEAGATLKGAFTHIAPNVDRYARASGDYSVSNAINEAGGYRGLVGEVNNNITGRMARALHGSGVTMQNLRDAYIESNLRDTREGRWMAAAKDADTADESQLIQTGHDGKDEQYLGLTPDHAFMLEALQDANKAFRGAVVEAETIAQAAYQHGDMDPLRFFLSNVYRQAAKMVKPHMKDAEYQRIINDAAFKNAHGIYQKQLEPALATSHSTNEGRFADFIGTGKDSLGSYYPLHALTEEGKEFRRKGDFGLNEEMRAPGNPHNNFRTGMSPQYDGSPEALRRSVSGAFSRNSKAQLVHAIEESPLGAKKGDKGLDIDPDSGKATMEIPGFKDPMPALPVVVSPPTRIYKDGKFIPIPSKSIYIPVFLRNETAKILHNDMEGWEKGPVDLQNVSRRFTQAMLWGPATAMFHARNLYGTTVAESSPAILYHTLLGGKVQDIGHRFADIFGGDPEMKSRDMREMGRLGILPERFGETTRRPEVAEATGAALVPKILGVGPRIAGHDILFGAEGADQLCRLAAFRSAKIMAGVPLDEPLEAENGEWQNPKLVAEISNYVNHLGQYSNALQPRVTYALRQSGLNPFGVASLQMQANGTRAWAKMFDPSTLPGKEGESGFKRRLAFKSAQTFVAGGVISALGFWCAAYKAITGKLPWEDNDEAGHNRSRLLQIPVPDKWRQSAAGQALWGKGNNVAYIDMRFLNPILLRGPIGGAAANLYNAATHRASAGQMVAEAGRGALNTTAEPLTESPMVRAVGAAAGVSPYMTSTTTTEKHGKALITKQTPSFINTLPPFESTPGNQALYRGAAFAGAINPGVGVAVNAAGLGRMGTQEPMTFKGKTVIANPQAALRGVTGIFFPSTIGSAANPAREDYNNMVSQHPVVKAYRGHR